MKLHTIFFIFLLIGVKSFSQDLKIQDVAISIDGKMLHLSIPEKKDNITRIVEIKRISDLSTPRKTGDENSFVKSVKNCKSETKTLLVSGEYIFRVIVQTPYEKNILEEQKFMIL